MMVKHTKHWWDDTECDGDISFREDDNYFISKCLKCGHEIKQKKPKFVYVECNVLSNMKVW
jgi:Zn ribbon nucleic-acid-binding protein